MVDLRGREHALQPLALLQQGTRLFVVPNSILDGKDGYGLIPGLHAVARGGLGLSGQERMIGQFGGPRSLGLQPRQSALVQDLPPRRAQVGVDHVTDQLMGEAIAARAAHSSCVLLAQEPSADGLLQSLDACLHP